MEETMRETALALLAALFLTTASGFAATKPRMAPPPLRIEIVTIQPGPHHVWIEGYWKWSGVNYTWIEGRWVKVKPNRAWVRGNWKPMGSFWAWTPGHWEKINIDEPKPAKKKEPKPSKKK
jgi:hypothetical protein